MLQTRIHHTQETCRRLALVQDKLFGFTRRAVRLMLALIPMGIGYLIGYDKLLGALSLVLGVMIYYHTAGMYEQDAEKAFASTPEKYRDVAYIFYDKFISVESGGARKEVDYGDIFALVMDGAYYYLFVNPQQAFMMELTCASPKEKIRFETFLSESTGKQWKPILVRETFFQKMRHSRGIAGRECQNHQQ